MLLIVSYLDLGYLRIVFPFHSTESLLLFIYFYLSDLILFCDIDIILTLKRLFFMFWDKTYLIFTSEVIKDLIKTMLKWIFF